ncbi:DUF1294 domain-containing protein [Cupriavidus sp. H18C2]|uniref:DUF1294 domain-containing protein n=1 Tax=Cupriavidus sp. H18C2 TaxID=3241602 RepID=UPI003BF7CEBC
MNVAAFVMFAIDMRRARDGQWRIQESHLHCVTLAGGFAGAQLARSMFRHKTQKISFHMVFWLSAFVWAVIGGTAYADLEMSRNRNDIKKTAVACPASQLSRSA